MSCCAIKSKAVLHAAYEVYFGRSSLLKQVCALGKLANPDLEAIACIVNLDR
jgi:hypothetical protein